MRRVTTLVAAAVVAASLTACAVPTPTQPAITSPSVPAECRDGLTKALEIMSKQAGGAQDLIVAVTAAGKGDYRGASSILDRFTADTTHLTDVEVPQLKRLSAVCFGDQS